MSSDTTSVVSTADTVDSVETVAGEAGEEAAPAAETESNPYADLNLDELMTADFGDDSTMQGTHKGLPPYAEILKHLPENGRKLIQNLRSSYTTKTQDIAELRKQVEAERAELQRQRELLSNSDFVKGINEKATSTPQHDAWTDEGLEERINMKAALMMQQMLKPLQEDIEAQQRNAQLNAFKAEHPEITSDAYRMPIARLLMERPELKLSDAYHIVNSQITKAAVSQKREVQAETLRKTSTGSAVRSGETPKFKDAWAAYNWHKANGVK